jgi:hypothetical protein
VVTASISDLGAVAVQTWTVGDTAVRSGHAQLDVERWQDPSLASEGSSPGGEYTLENYFVTAARSQLGELDVEVWETSSDTGGPPPK